MQLALERPAASRWRTWRRRSDLEGYLFLAPDMLGTLVFAVGPVLVALALGLFAWDILTPPRFVCLANYRMLLLDDPVFRQVLFNMRSYVIRTAPVRAALPLLLAIALNQQLHG